MKFQQVPVGQRFEFESQVYVKISPLVAQVETSGTQRLLPRSAVVRLLDQEKATSPRRNKKSAIDPAEIIAAAEQFHAECVSNIETLIEVVGPERTNAVISAVDKAYADFRERIQREMSLS